MPSNSDKFNELYLKPLKNSSQYLLNLVNDILDIQKIKFNHKLILVKKEFNLIQFMNEVFEMMELKAKAKEIDLILKFDRNLPTNIYTDD